MSNRFFGGLFDAECPHGLGMKAWCGLCNGSIKPPNVKKPKPDKAEEADSKPVVPKCSICIKKAEKHDGHGFHRTYIKLYDPSTVHGRNPNRAIGNIQVRKVFDATHQDDAGRQVCDECCMNRCTLCKSFDPKVGNVMPQAKVERVSVSERLLVEDSGMWQHITGMSAKNLAG